MKTCVFINLPAAEARRRALEASFGGMAAEGWVLERFPALGPADVGSVPGVLTDPEKGCFCSHRDALGRHLGSDAPLFIAEDDAAFSGQALAVAEALLQHGPHWDILLTDVAISETSMLVRLARQRDGMVARGEFSVIDLAGLSHFGATGYLVRASAKRRLHEALSAAAPLDRPYDLFLGDLARNGAFRIGVCFPFVTTVTPAADASQIQSSEHAVFDQAFSAFRRLMYVERDLEQCRRDSAALRAAHPADTAQMVGSVFAALVSPAFPFDR